MFVKLSFVPVVYEKENDMRFVYCVTTVSYILNDFSAIDKQKTIDFIKKSLVCISLLIIIFNIYFVFQK